MPAIFQSCYCEDAQQSKSFGDCCTTEDDNEAKVFHHTGQLHLFLDIVCVIIIVSDILLWTYLFDHPYLLLLLGFNMLIFLVVGSTCFVADRD